MLAVMWWVKYFVNLCETASWVETSYVVFGVGVILYVWFLVELGQYFTKVRLHTENLPPTEP